MSNYKHAQMNDMPNSKAEFDAVLAETTANGISNKGIIGGGDQAAAAVKLDMDDEGTFGSTGGSASLELLKKNVPQPLHLRPALGQRACAQRTAPA